MDGFQPKFWKYQTNDVISNCEKFVDLFFLFFFLMLQLEQDIAKVCAKFQRAPFIRFEEFRSKSQVHLLSKF